MEIFDFEKLEVWKCSVEFADMVIDISEHLNSENKHYRIVEQLEAAATSVAMNIAEGKGRFSTKEFIQFLYYSRGSVNEVATLITILYNRTWVTQKDYQLVHTKATQLSKMLNALIKSLKARSS